MAGKDEVRELARKLNEWAQKELKEYPKQQTLLRWLLSRCESREIEVPENAQKDGKSIEGRYVIERKDISKIDIEKAVIDGLAGLSPNPNELPTSGWVRGGPIWPRSYTWPRS